MNETVKMEKLKARIERMSKTQHIEILKLLLKNPEVKINENKSGVYINLSWLPSITISMIEEYICYIDQQENALSSTECQKEEYKRAFFSDSNIGI